MAKGIANFKITGIKEALNKIDKNYNVILNTIDNEMEAGVLLMATNAKILFKPDLPEIRRSIRSVKYGFLNYALIAGTANDPLAAYIEFGTGKYFSKYPGKEIEWQKLANIFYVDGKGRTYPQPYLYPAVKSGLVTMLSNIKNTINKNA